MRSEDEIKKKRDELLDKWGDAVCNLDHAYAKFLEAQMILLEWVLEWRDY